MTHNGLYLIQNCNIEEYTYNLYLYIADSDWLAISNPLPASVHIFESLSFLLKHSTAVEVCRAAKSTSSFNLAKAIST